MRGVVGFSSPSEAPVLADGRPALSVVLVGNVGGSIWPAFRAWRAGRADGGGVDPLDRWSKTVIGAVARDRGATAWFPSDPPYQPFQQWAIRAEGLKASPLGILIHPEYGLWHGYRGALGFDQALPESVPHAGPHPCDVCAQKPCLAACPVSAVTPAGFVVGPCRAHLSTPRGKAECMRAGCLARNACPIGSAYRYGEEQLRFHMAALSL